MLSNNDDLTEVVMLNLLISTIDEWPDLDKLAIQINILGYYILETNVIGTYFFCTCIPRKEIAGFMKVLCIY